MVDRDRILERTGGGSDSSDDESGGRDRSPSKKSGKGSKTKSKSTGSGSGKVSKSEELEKFKKASGVSSADPDSKSGVPRSDAVEVLKAIANVLLYAEGKSRAVEEPDNTREEYSKIAADNLYEQYTEITSLYEVQLIAEKYGIDWEEDIIMEVLKEQDYTGKVGV